MPITFAAPTLRYSPSLGSENCMSERTTPATSNPIAIRAAAMDDLPAILALEQAAPGAAHWTAEHYRSRVQSGAQDACFLVAESERKICGFLCSRIVAGEWEIENVVVEGKFRRHGIGEQLMRSFLAKWEESTGAEVLLEVRESNLAARSLYRKYGLQEVGRRRGYYGEPTEDAVLYARRRPS